MNVQSGDLAYITFPQYFGLPVTVGEFYGQMYELPTWWVSCNTPMKCEDGIFKTRFLVPDIYLRRIGGGPLDEENPIEAPIKTDVAEALRLGLGIESRWAA